MNLVVTRYYWMMRFADFEKFEKGWTKTAAMLGLKYILGELLNFAESLYMSHRQW